MEQDATEKLALIDVGSNTIRTVVYGRRGNRARKLYSERDYTGLIAYVSNGRLTEEGVAKLCATMAHMKRFCALCRCESVTAFSTASLRGITNRAETVEKRASPSTSAVAAVRSSALTRTAWARAPRSPSGA